MVGCVTGSPSFGCAPPPVGCWLPNIATPFLCPTLAAQGLFHLPPPPVCLRLAHDAMKKNSSADVFPELQNVVSLIRQPGWIMKQAIHQN
jgi:hypothetical protein